MNWLNGFNLRTFLFGAGAIAAVAQAIDLALKADAHVTTAHLVALGATALCAFAMKWPGDVTKEQAADREAELAHEPGDEEPPHGP